MSRVVAVPADSIEGVEALWWPSKDPDEVLDYSLDWSARLLDSGDDIVSSDWDWGPASEITLNLMSVDVATAITKCWLTGGVEGKTYSFTNTVTTEGDRVYEQTVYIAIIDR